MNFFKFPGSLDPRCPRITTTITRTTPRPTSTTERQTTFTPSSTTIRTTTESVLCYPGSTAPGCKDTGTTPSFCYPGSPDKRCPQPKFSTRMPSTYLPPFPDSPKNNRVKREAIIANEPRETIKFSMSFKGYSL